LAEALVKELTGGDLIRARRMREDFWQFSPSHKIIVCCNHRPIVRGTDNGIWRRLRLVPFEVVFAPEQQDKTLPDRLRKELHGVLTWCVRGCLEWQARGMQEPADVLAATVGYRDEQDVLGDFFEGHCIIEPTATVSAGRLYVAYTDWCKASGHDPDNSTVFGRKLTERGFTSRKVPGGSKVREGIALLQAPNEF
jgi:putative DNA primase/helicase